MDELRLVESNEEFLVLESAAGEKFRLLIDDELRAATKRVLSVKAVTEAISPREIQQQIRAGVSPAHLASQTGFSVELIEKFAAPVIDEIAYIVSSAQAIRLSIAGARPNTTEHVEFGEVISGRLRASGASGASWTAIKLDGSAWRVSIDFQLGDQSHTAAWVFEPRKLTLAPENDMAIRLSTEEVLASQPAVSLRVLSTEQPVAEVPVAAVVADIENETLEEELDHQVEVESTATTDLLLAMRLKRESRKTDQTKEAAIEEQPQDSKVVDASRVDPEAALSQEMPAEAEIAQVEPEKKQQAEPEKKQQAEPKKSRASMPSWDQIVFGSKADD
jgi:Protein of unknown function (DUF3071)